jgi:hypothetical protein
MQRLLLARARPTRSLDLTSRSKEYVNDTIDVMHLYNMNIQNTTHLPFSSGVTLVFERCLCYLRWPISETLLRS